MEKYFFDFAVIFMIAFIISFSATPIARKIAALTGAVDLPGEERRMHQRPMARLGGLAIIAGFFFSLLFIFISSSLEEGIIIAGPRQIIGLLAGSLLIIAMGIADDIKKLGPVPKFAIQFAAALIVVLISGMRIEYLSNPFSPHGYSLLPLYISYPLTILWIAGITNAINLIDGLDGLASGVTAISSISLFFIMLLSHSAEPFAPFVGVLTLALAGSALGFLPFNFYPAKIIMGDTGAYFLGFVLSIISLQGALKSYAAISISIPLIIVGIPLFDTTSAIFRRILRGRSFMHADRAHIHHRLIDMGLSHKQSVIVMYMGTAALGLSAIVLTDKGTLSAVILILLLIAFITGGACFMNDLNSEQSLLRKKNCGVPGTGADAPNTGATEVSEQKAADISEQKAADISEQKAADISEQKATED